MKLAKTLWSAGSVLVNFTIIIYIFLSSNAPLDPVDRHHYLNEHWSVYAAHWKAEFLFMTMIAIGAFYFSLKTQKISWAIITLGQGLLLITYPIMLGGFRNTSFELSEMSNQMALILFVFGNIVFLSGLFCLYLHDQILAPWLSKTGAVLSLITGIAFVLVFMGWLEWREALVIAPLMNVLYLLNAFYGLKLRIEKK